MVAAVRAVCWVHRIGDPVDVVFLCEHHRQPRAFGGDNDPENLIWLCSGCHDILHRLATMKAARKAGLVQDFLSLYLPSSPAARERLETLVSEVLKAKLASSNTAVLQDDQVLLTLKVPRSVHSKLKTLSMDYLHASGRKVGLAAYAAFVLYQHTLATQGSVLPQGSTTTSVQKPIVRLKPAP